MRDSGVGEIEHNGCVVARRRALARIAIDDAELTAFDDRPRTEDEVDAHTAPHVKVAGSIVPPGEDLLVLVKVTKDVGQTPLLKGGKLLALGCADVSAATGLDGIPDVAVLRRDVEVTRDD